MGREVKASVELFIHSSSCTLSERLSKEVLCLDTWNEALIPWDILSLQVLAWSTNPVVAETRYVSILNFLTLLICGRLM